MRGAPAPAPGRGRRGPGVPGAAARTDPTAARRRGRVPPGRPGVGPAAGQHVRPLLGGPAAVADRDLSRGRRARRRGTAAAARGGGGPRVGAAGCRRRARGRRPEGRRLDRGGHRRPAVQPDDRRGRGQGRAARAAVPVGQRAVHPAGGPAHVGPPRTRVRAGGGARRRPEAEPRHRPGLRGGAAPRRLAHRPAPGRPDARARHGGRGRRGGAGGGYRRLGPDRRRSIGDAVGGGLRVPHRRRPGDRRRQHRRPGGAGVEPAGDRPRLRAAADRRRPVRAPARGLARRSGGRRRHRRRGHDRPRRPRRRWQLLEGLPDAARPGCRAVRRAAGGTARAPPPPAGGGGGGAPARGGGWGRGRGPTRTRPGRCRARSSTG